MLKNIRDEIMDIKDIIVQTVPVEQIYLFGSHACGTPHQDSDLDFYVVLPDDIPYREVEALDKINMALWKHNTSPTDILVAKKSRFEYRLSALTLENEVVETGVLLYETLR